MTTKKPHALTKNTGIMTLSALLALGVPAATAAETSTSPSPTSTVIDEGNGFFTIIEYTTPQSPMLPSNSHTPTPATVAPSVPPTSNSSETLKPTEQSSPSTSETEQHPSETASAEDPSESSTPSADPTETSQPSPSEEVEPTYAPVVLSAYPATAAGYVMPFAGGGFAPNSTVTVSAHDGEGNSVPGISFAPRNNGETPTADQMASATNTLEVTTDESGNFEVYVVTSPYMTSGRFSLYAEDSERNLNASEELTVFGESVAELTLSQTSVPVGHNAPITIAGDKFAPSFADYPVELRLVRDEETIASQTITLTHPGSSSIWSSFKDVELTLGSDLHPGNYTLQAVVPGEAGNIPEQYRNRLLAATQLSVTSQEPELPLPSESSIPAPPESSEPADQEIPPVAPDPEPLPEETLQSPSIPAGEVTEQTDDVLPPESPSIAPTTEVEVVTSIRQDPAASPSESAIEQNPVWLQTSSIAPDDPRITNEPNAQLRSSVLEAQGMQENGTRLDPNLGGSLPGQVNTSDDGSAIINLNRSTPWSAILGLTGLALIIGAATGVFIARTSRTKN